MPCSKCNRPCIVVNGSCLIAEVRRKYNLSFADAWETITRCNYDDPIYPSIQPVREINQLMVEKVKQPDFTRFLQHLSSRDGMRLRSTAPQRVIWGKIQ